MVAILSSNRSKSAWARYIERPTSLERLMAENPRTSVRDVVIDHAATVAARDPFAQVAYVDELGAPHLSGAGQADFPCENP
jgi:hypothetical protein